MAALPLTLTIGAIAEPAKQLLPTGQALTPTATSAASFTPLVARTGPQPFYVADGAATIAASPDKREMLVLTSGYNRYNGVDGKRLDAQSTQYVLRHAISNRGARWVQTLQFPNTFGGVTWQPDGRGFVVGGGVDDAIYLFARHGSQFVAAGKIPLGHEAGPGADVLPQAAEVAASPDGLRALVANYYNDSVSLLISSIKQLFVSKICGQAKSTWHEAAYRRRVPVRHRMDRREQCVGLGASRATAR